MILLYFLLVFAIVLALLHCLLILKQAHHDPRPEEGQPRNPRSQGEYHLSLLIRHNSPEGLQ
ncbi:MAG: hypothetical protein CL537_09380 [Alcanivoracaceae bacterium]|nr:hypothetical protein [Alcanivoracaceae bacterium]|tara:strand:- start:1196 stop:1381 length:186 start_codon:yes stop_codon:yes gene_type:complete